MPIITVTTSEEFYELCKRAKSGEFTIYGLEVGKSHKRKKKDSDGRPFLYRLTVSENHEPKTI